MAWPFHGPDRLSSRLKREWVTPFRICLISLISLILLDFQLLSCSHIVSFHGFIVVQAHFHVCKIGPKDPTSQVQQMGYFPLFTDSGSVNNHGHHPSIFAIFKEITIFGSGQEHYEVHFLWIFHSGLGCKPWISAPRRCAPKSDLQGSVRTPGDLEFCQREEYENHAVSARRSCVYSFETLDALVWCLLDLAVWSKSR